MRTIATYPSQRGTVLVTVLMMFAIAALLATEMAYRQKLDIRRTSAMLMTEQAREYLIGAEELAKLALKDDFKSDKRSGKPVDGLKEEWALKRPPFPVEGGLIQGEIIDAQSKFNINSLVDAAGDVRNPQLLAKANFIKLLTALDVPEEGSPQEVYDKIVDWLDKDQNPSGFDGSEDGEYLRHTVPFRTGNRFCVDVSELKSIEGLDIKTYNTIEPYLTALPPETKLNLNTANAEILSAMTVDTKIIVEREANPLQDTAGKIPQKADFPGISPTVTDADIEKQFSVYSNFFELHAKAVIGGRSVYSRAILYRPDISSTKGDKIEVIYRAFVDPLQQPMTPVAARP